MIKFLAIVMVLTIIVIPILVMRKRKIKDSKENQYINSLEFKKFFLNSICLN